MRTPLARFAWLAIGAAFVVVALKVGAWWLTGSAGLLSDAVESFANVAGAVMAYLMLGLAALPPDEEHAYGHSKAEYFSSGFEGGLILIAAAWVVWIGFSRLLHPVPLEALGIGLGIAAVATVLNFWVARILLKAGTEHGSVALESSGHHLMTDVWTSVGVIAGVWAVALTGWERMDAVIALAVAVHILVVGVSLVRRAALGLLDTALPEDQLRTIEGILKARSEGGIEFHALRTRRAGRRSFVSMHVLVPGDWTVQRGHDFLEEVEREVRERIPGASVFTHLEPVEDPVSFQDQVV